MTPEESGNVILGIFQRACAKPGEVLTNQAVHKEYFRKTDSGLGFTEGINWLIQRKWLTPVEGKPNCHQMTKAGWGAEV